MKKCFFLLLILTAVFLEVSILNSFRIFNVKPSLLLILVVIASLSFELRWALFFCILAGALKDIFCVNIFCWNALMFALLCFLISKLSREITVDNYLVSIILVFFVVFLSDIIVRLAFAYSGKYIPLGIFLRTAFFESLYTMLVAPLVFKVVKPEFYLSPFA